MRDEMAERARFEKWWLTSKTARKGALKTRRAIASAAWQAAHREAESARGELLKERDEAVAWRRDVLAPLDYEDDAPPSVVIALVARIRKDRDEYAERALAAEKERDALRVEVGQLRARMEEIRLTVTKHHWQERSEALLHALTVEVPALIDEPLGNSADLGARWQDWRYDATRALLVEANRNLKRELEIARDHAHAATKRADNAQTEAIKRIAREAAHGDSVSVPGRKVTFHVERLVAPALARGDSDSGRAGGVIPVNRDAAPVTESAERSRPSAPVAAQPAPSTPAARASLPSQPTRPTRVRVLVDRGLLRNGAVLLVDSWWSGDAPRVRIATSTLDLWPGEWEPAEAPAAAPTREWVPREDVLDLQDLAWSEALAEAAAVCRARRDRHNDNASEKSDLEGERFVAGRRASEADACAKAIGALPFAYKPERRKAQAAGLADAGTPTLAELREKAANALVSLKWGDDGVTKTYAELAVDALCALLAARRGEGA